MECWQLESIDKILAVDKNTCETTFGKLAALTKLIHNIEGINIELRIISHVSEKYIKMGKQYKERLSLLI